MLKEKLKNILALFWADLAYLVISRCHLKFSTQALRAFNSLGIPLRAKWVSVDIEDVVLNSVASF